MTTCGARVTPTPRRSSRLIRPAWPQKQPSCLTSCQPLGTIPLPVPSTSPARVSELTFNDIGFQVFPHVCYTARCPLPHTLHMDLQNPSILLAGGGLAPFTMPRPGGPVPQDGRTPLHGLSSPQPDAPHGLPPRPMQSQAQYPVQYQHAYQLYPADRSALQDRPESIPIAPFPRMWSVWSVFAMPP